MASRLFGFILSPFSRHNFTLKALERMLLAGTCNANMFKYKKGDEHSGFLTLNANIPDEFKGTKIEKLGVNHKVIKFSNY